MRAKEFVNETTTAGGIATVSAALGPTFTRGASIYGEQPKKKKKSRDSNKYKNSYNKD